MQNTSVSRKRGIAEEYLLGQLSAAIKSSLAAQASEQKQLIAEPTVEVSSSSVSETPAQWDAVKQFDVCPVIRNTNPHHTGQRREQSAAFLQSKPATQAGRKTEGQKVKTPTHYQQEASRSHVIMFSTVYWEAALCHCRQTMNIPPRNGGPRKK